MAHPPGIIKNGFGIKPRIWYIPTRWRNQLRFSVLLHDILRETSFSPTDPHSSSRHVIFGMAQELHRISLHLALDDTRTSTFMIGIFFVGGQSLPRGQ